MNIAITQVDAFTDQPFAGNPAAVCLLQQPREESWMKLVAREINLPETAFLLPRDGGFGLRWFTPTMEVDLCGHATLASAHFLWEDRHLPPDQIARFHTRSGWLTAEKKGAWIEMDFPATPSKSHASCEDLELGLSVRPSYVGRSRFDYMVGVETEQIVRDLKPDFSILGRLETRGVIVTSRASSSGFDFVSRFFAPAAGINEDSVTGSAHCCLGPFWKERLGRDDLVGYQASARGGVVRTRCVGDRVLISGKAVTVLHCELL